MVRVVYCEKNEVCVLMNEKIPGFKLPGLAAGSVVPHGVSAKLAKDAQIEREREERKRADRRNLIITIVVGSFNAIGAIFGVMAYFK